ncbi:hypothetical protein NTE_00837 [Candidatus Nitrososphaera evergladensis SR1]|uniref:Uncharacterized protein n=1 Tax=Candidatus Nitrososphaera evergladensis SR1 TaxID=1459636 RepID=A0A075MNW9_9ARCH|nr:hypothetical protein NTE_00837 [Candidatus Nitrososphaera evergladensis SR1]
MHLWSKRSTVVSWSYIVVCKKCGYISAEKLPEQEAKDLRRSHLEGSHGCTISHITLMKVRT